jgi:DNA-binding transcriptional LysR family regulator
VLFRSEHAWRLAEFRPRIAATAPSFSALIFALPGTSLVATAQRKLAKTIAPILGLSVYPCPLAIPELREDMIWHERNRENLAHAYMRQLMIEEAASLANNHN